MKKLLALLMALALIGSANAVHVTNGGFDSPGVTGGTDDNGDAWFQVGGGDAGTPEWTWEATGGNPDGHITLTNTQGNQWNVWYTEYLKLAELGIPAGIDVIYSFDNKEIGAGTDLASCGYKFEAWDTGTDTELFSTGDQFVPVTAGVWTNYQGIHTIPENADAVKYVFINVTYGSGTASAYAWDNASIEIPGGTPALMPVPTAQDIYNPDGQGVGLLTTQVSWVNPDPNDPAQTMTAEAYLLESDTPLVEDPNLGPDVFDAGVVALPVDAGQESASVSLTEGKYYYWAVHVTDPNYGGPVTIPGFVWRFQTANSAPTIEVDDQYLVAAADPMVISIDATVIDDGETPVTIQWTDVTNADDKHPETIVTINSPTTEDTTITLTNANPEGALTGYYLFEITADDGANLPATEQVIIQVLGTCGEAADADPDDPYDITGDLNLDCKKDMADFAIFAAGWLDCNTLRTEDVTCP